MEVMDVNSEKLLAVLKGLGAAGVLDRNSLALIGFELTKRGQELIEAGHRADGADLLKLADATGPLHAELQQAESEEHYGNE
ncbi:MAG TPA: hypothetical protein VF650_02695 [Allosphingosinicella sp.]|jgi:hypothetical protein